MDDDIGFRVERPQDRPSNQQLEAWVTAAMEAARKQGRDLPDAAVSPADSDALFLGAINAIGRRPALGRYRHRMSCARAEFRRGDFVRAEYALRTAASMLSRKKDEGGTFGTDGLDDLLLDALEIGFRASKRRDADAAERGFRMLLDQLAAGGDALAKGAFYARLSGAARLLGAESAGAA